MKKFILIFLFLCLASIACARGLEVSPSTYVWKGVTPGKLAKMPAQVIVINSSDKSRSYTLRALPDLGWIKLAKDRIEVGPNDHEGVEVFLLVPERQEHQGRQYIFYVEVKEASLKSEQISLAGYPKIYVQTTK